jgi:hypothetical protein
MGFCSLQHTRDRRSTCRGLCLPATFRLQGLATLLTACSLRALAGFVSHRRRSWDSPFGAFSSRKVSARFRPEAPTYRSTWRYTPCEHEAGSTGCGSWVLTLSRVPGDQRVFSAPTAGCSLGFHPSRAYLQRPWTGFRPPSSHALGVLRPRHHGVSISLRLGLPTPEASPGGCVSQPF